MDSEVQPNPPHENGSQIEESSTDPPDEAATNGKDVKIPPKAVLITRETRSRSRTPQKKKDKKAEEGVKANLKAVEESVNGHSEKKIRSAEKKTEKEESKVVADVEKNGIAKDDVKDKAEVLDNEPEELKKSTRKALKDDTEKPKEPEPATTDTLEPEAPPKPSVKPENEGVDMDPLILATDEPDPELQFDENSDMDSGKGSPIQTRCKTRRSHTRNIPTPKTPKSATDSESEKNSVAPTPTPENLNETSESLNVDDTSTKAEVGSDTTRLDYIANNTSVLSDDNSYLNYSRDRSLSETLRGLTPRKTIRPLNDSYRQRAFRNNLNKSDLNTPLSDLDMTDRITGIKRKVSVTPEERKKFKSSESTSTGFVSYLASPLSNFKSRFYSDGSMALPKLTSYKDGSKDIHEDFTYTETVNEEPGRKNRCAVM